MRVNRLIPIAVLAFAVACSESASDPVEPRFGKGGTTANPSFSFSTYSLTNAFGLNHTWEQKGLGNFTNVPYLLTADATITAHCVNGSGKNTVQGAPFDINQSLSSGPQTFPEKNGKVNGSITLSPAGVSCAPPGNNPHTAVIDAVQYFNIRFCWGKESPVVADLQGPEPPTGTVPPSPQSGTPLTGSEAGTTGIFEACA